jgi:hypothetical protein
MFSAAADLFPNLPRDSEPVLAQDAADLRLAVAAGYQRFGERRHSLWLDKFDVLATRRLLAARRLQVSGVVSC